MSKPPSDSQAHERAFLSPACSAHPKLARPRIQSIKNRRTSPAGRVSSCTTRGHRYVSTPISPFTGGGRQPATHPLLRLALPSQPHRSRRRGCPHRPTASSSMEAPPGLFTTAALLTGSGRELHPHPDRLGRGHAMDLLPGATVGFLNWRN